MESWSHGDVVVRRGDVEAVVLGGREGIEQALALLDRAESAASVPLVDEAERARLQTLAAGGERAPHHHSLLVRRGSTALGYGGLIVPEAAGGTATGDVVETREQGPHGPVLAALLAGTAALALRHGAGRVQLWIRHATREDLAGAADEGFDVERRLGVLGRDLSPPIPAAPPPTGARLRSYVTDADDRAVVDLLRSAYQGTPDAGWDLDAFAQRRSYGWFEPTDLLLAVPEGPGGDREDEGRLVGLHWMKRRSAAVGEVYNLAVAPSAQGRGVGAALLSAGLRHLRGQGCRQVLLWVDLANERAVGLYASGGFRTLWEDVSLGRTLP